MLMNRVPKLIPRKYFLSCLSPKYSTASADQISSIPFHFDISPESQHHTDIFMRDMTIVPNFITETEENSLFEEIQNDLRRRRYEYDHWDNAIIGFRELERHKWNPNNEIIINKIRNFAFPPNSTLIKHVHVLDLSESGHIKPHVDSVKFCGNTIAGISLLSDSIMRLVMEEDKSIKFDVFLTRRSLYVMRDEVRFKFTHEILKKEDSVFKGVTVDRGRRISLICRNEKL